jgi:hypothetical protein
VPVWEDDGILCTGETYKDKVKLTFAKGARLPDPAGLFNAGFAFPAGHGLDVGLDGGVALALGDLRIAAREELGVFPGHPVRVADPEPFATPATERPNLICSHEDTKRAGRMARWRAVFVSSCEPSFARGSGNHAS